MRNPCALAAVLFASGAVVACSTAPEVQYVSSSSAMSAGQAEYIVKDTLAGGRLVSVTNDSYYRTSDAKLRPDGVGFLWIRARDPGGTKPLVYDSPPQFKACYFAQASSPQVIHYSLNKLLAVRGLCEVEVWFGTLDEAKQFADALFVLRQRQR